MKNKTTIKEVTVLLEKYYDGLTTVNEERRLQAFLSGNELPARFNADKAILGYFNTQKQPRKNGFIIPFIRWTAVAAAAAVTALLIYNTQPLSSRNNYAFINGKLVTNTDILHASALASIQELTSSSDEVQKSANLLNNDEELMDQQLSLFKGLD